METLDKPQKIHKLKNFLAKHKKTLIITACCLATVGLTIGALFLFIRKPTVVNNPEPVVNHIEPIPEPVKYYSKLTGLLVENEQALSAPVTAVMIENSPEARPQSGLKEAEIVFEAIAEGGITRFMALFQNNKPELIGPVRSVRLYYVNWLSAFNASIIHCGGSEEALNEVRNGTYRDLDQYFNDSAFWRSNDRYAPHNLYTSFANIEALNKAKGYTSSSFDGYINRVEPKPAETLDATNININISSYLFNSSFAYSAETNSYARSQAGAAHLDSNGLQLAPNVVIAMSVDESTLADGHERITTIGSGTATIFQNGTAIKATWSKDSASSQIIFKDAVGNEIPLVSGQIWIVAVPNDTGEVVWS